MCPRAVLLSFAIGVLLSTATVRAEPGDAAREQARALAAQGYDALQRKDYAAAESAFRRADALVHAPTIVVDHARALVGLGRLVEAHERYERVLREGVPPNSPTSWQHALEDAEDELDAIKPRLAWLTIRVRGPSKPEVRVDTKPIPRAALNVRRAMDPGVRTVSVQASGYLPKEKTVTLVEGQKQKLEIELEPDPTNTAELEEQREEAIEPGEVVPSQTSSKKSNNNTLSYVALGVGGTSLVVGLVTGFLTLRTRSDLDTNCPDRVCQPRYQADVDRYRLFGTVSGVALSVGVAAGATGCALLLFGGGSAETGSAHESPRASAAAYFSTQGFGVRGEF